MSEQAFRIRQVTTLFTHSDTVRDKDIVWNSSRYSGLNTSVGSLIQICALKDGKRNSLPPPSREGFRVLDEHGSEMSNPPVANLSKRIVFLCGDAGGTGRENKSHVFANRNIECSAGYDRTFGLQVWHFRFLLYYSLLKSLTVIDFDK